MITRLRPAHTASKLAELYTQPHDASKFVDHQFRIADTIAACTGVWGTAADLSCGDGSILRAVQAPIKYFGDLAPGYAFMGPLEVTLAFLPGVDLYICTETLEHLDDPGHVLELIRDKAGYLVLSTPVEAWDDANQEHYWAWDREGVEDLLEAAGWRVDEYRTSDHRASGFQYCYGIWRCS
jgi:hypothetical protein